jgi:hypothetical protein
MFYSRTTQKWSFNVPTFDKQTSHELNRIRSLFKLSLPMPLFVTEEEEENIGLNDQHE